MASHQAKAFSQPVLHEKRAPLPLAAEGPSISCLWSSVKRQILLGKCPLQRLQLALRIGGFFGWRWGHK